jgi:DnaJ-class molecular chaperone
MQAISQGPCGQCSGEGRRPIGVCQGCRGAKVSTQKKGLDVAIEPGMRPGEKIVFARECSDSHDYHEPGDVHIVLQEADEDIELRRAGDDLTLTAHVTFTEAILGCTRNIHGHPAHKEGLMVTIGQGVQHGDTVVIAGEGMPRKGGGGRGNLLVRVEVKVSDEERAKLVANRDALAALFTSEQSS